MLFSASLGCLGVLGDRLFLDSCGASVQCAVASMKMPIAEVTEVAEEETNLNLLRTLASKAELKARILHSLQDRNADPGVSRWRYKLEDESVS